MAANEAENEPLIQKTTSHKKSDFTLRLIIAGAACVIGSSFQFGYSNGLTNSPQEVLKQFINNSYEGNCNETISEELLTTLWAVTSSAFGIGSMIGSLIAGPISDVYGSKTSLLMNNVLALMASILSSFSKMAFRFEMIIAGRLLSGINGGINCAVAPVYLTEISPISTRGYMGSSHQIGIATSSTLAYILGLSKVFGTYERFPLMFGFKALLAIFQLSTLSFCPESPRFLMLKRKDEKAAEKALIWFRQKTDVSHDIEEMKIEQQDLERQKKFSVGDLLSNGDLRRPLFLCIMIHLCQQLSGISAIASYSTSVFQQVVSNLETSAYLTVSLGGFGVLTCFLFTGFIERSGRRTLQLVGVAGMVICLSIVTLCFVFQDKYDWLVYIAIVFIYMYALFLNVGPASIPWFIVAEMFTQGSKAAAMTITVFVNTSFSFIITLLFPIIQEFIEQYSFLPFACSLVILWVYFYFKLPETKGKTIEETAVTFRRPNKMLIINEC